MQAILQARLGERIAHFSQIGLSNLDNGAELFIEEKLDLGLAGRQCVELERHSNSTGEHHLADCG